MPGTSSDTVEQVKKAFRSIFRRRKPVKPTQAPAPAPRLPAKSRLRATTSAGAAPEVIPDAPSWPMTSPFSPASGYYATPVELPGALAPFAPLHQHRSKSDAGAARQASISDLFSELDSSSVRRLSVGNIAINEDAVSEMPSPMLDQRLEAGVEEPQLQELQTEIPVDAQPEPQAEPQYESGRMAVGHQADAEEGETPRDETAVAQMHQPEITQTHQPTSDNMTETTSRAESNMAQEYVEAPEEPVQQDEDASEDAKDDESVSSKADVSDDDDDDDDNNNSSISQQRFARNDSANGEIPKDDDDASSIYSASSVSDGSVTATVSTPRTCSVAKMDSTDYFDEKIPVLSEPPQVFRTTPAPGMAATSGPLEEFTF